MSVILFSHQVTDVRGQLQRIHQCRKSTVLVDSFLEKAFAALRHDVCTLPREARSQLQAFNGVFDLSERYHSAKTQRFEISCALFCISQLAHFFGFFEQHPDKYPVPGDDNLVIGVGLGQLSAAAVSCSKTIADLFDPAVEAIHLAFRVGAVVERYSSSSQQTDVDEGYWNVTVAGSVDEIESELQTYQDQMKIPKSARAYISAINSKDCSVSGPPSRLRQLQTHMKLLKNATATRLPVAGFWNASHIYGQDQISEVIEARLSALDEIVAPCRAILSPSTGELIQLASSKLLFARAIDDMLRRRVMWTALQQTVADHFYSKSMASNQIATFEVNPSTANSFVMLQSGIKHSIEKHDISSWCSHDASLKPQGRFFNSNIAVVGMSGRFPGATDNESFWELLEKGRDMHQKIPKDRFDVETHVDPSGKKTNAGHTPYGCFIQDPGLFDPRFFNMSPREATQTDPMHRLALVTAYEALEQSGFVLNSTASTQQDRVGTFYGQTSDDWREVNAAQEIATYFIPGGVRAFAPGRISYYFGFRGPSYSVDTACSSSLAAIQIACTSLRTAECDTAVAGGLNILTAPDIFAGLSKGQFLSPTGSCKTWDSKADGYCRADGVGSVVLKREEDAINEGDNILGVILATATNHSADAISITHPHAGNQSYLYESVLHTAGVDPLDVSYVEMHGTGTQAGDVTEMQSVTDVFAPDTASRSRKRDSDHALHIGAVKSSIGHGEAAAGVSALIKVLMMFQKSAIPPHVGIKNTLNPAFSNLEVRNVRIPFRKTNWPRIDEKPRVAFLNNFSAAGGNTAMVLRDPPQRALPLQVDPRSMFPFVVSSKSLSSMRNNIQQLISFLQDASEASLASLSYTLTARRMHHNYRIGVAASDLDTLKRSFMAEAEKGEFTATPSKAPAVAFVFTGQGAFYASLGKELFETSTLFRSEIIHLNELATAQGFPSFLPAIDGNVDHEHQLLAQATQLALVSVQIALVNLWRSWGIMPSVVLGHSLGEYSALYAAGVLTEHDVIYLVGSRAKLLQEKCVAGAYSMLAVKASIAEIKIAINGLSFEVACVNGPSDTVLCGSVQQVEHFSQLLKRAGYKGVVLDLPYAFHSSQIEPILADFKSLAGGVIFGKPRIPVISPLLGEVIEVGNVFNPVYLCRQARETVNFANAVEAANESGIFHSKTVFVEIGPHPICSSMIKTSLEYKPLTVASLHKKETPWTTLSKSVCSLHSVGLEIDWREFHSDFAACHELLSLPAYKFDNKNYWIDYVNDWCLHKIEPRAAKLAQPSREISKLSTSCVHRVVSQEFDGVIAKVVAQSDLSESALRAAIKGHSVNATALCPSTIYADIAFTLGDYVYKEFKPDATRLQMNCREMEVTKPLILRERSNESQILQITIDANLSEGWAHLRYATVNEKGTETIIHATCTVTYEDSAKWVAEWASNAYLIEGRIETLRDQLASGKADQISRGLAYKLFSAFVQYDAKYQGMEEVILNGKNFEATSRVKFQSEEKDGVFFLSPFWIDSLAHLSGFILNGSDAVDSKNFVYISHGWGSLRISRPLSRTKTYASYVKMQASPNNVMVGDVYIFEENIIIGLVGGLKFQRIPRTLLNTILPLPQEGPSQSTKSNQPLARVSSPNQVVKSTQSNLSNIIPQGSRESSKPVSNIVSSRVKAAAPLSGSVVSQIMSIISHESELPLSELLDDCTFHDLGIDSLLSLEICGKIRESVQIDIPSTVFVEYETVGMLKNYLQRFEEIHEDSSATSSSASSDDDKDAESEGSATTTSTRRSSVSKDSSSQNGDKAEQRRRKEIMMLFRTTIAEQMDIDLEEIIGSSDLLSLGMDSLMSICILGILREQTGIDLPSSLFVDSPSLNDIETFLGFSEPITPAPVKVSKRPKGISNASSTSSFDLLDSPQAVSIIMQGKPNTATKTLFLFPDGSGSATSYASIPALDQRIAVYGLNSPFMTNPSDFNNGIDGAASIYLTEIRRRQPSGPYHLGGWSAGGILAYEATLQLQAQGERVDSLIFFDSPCPINLEPLPSRLHEFLADVGLLGGERKEPPPWLLPHFEATIKALASYKPAPIIIKDKKKTTTSAPRTLAIWARHGVCGRPGDPRPELYDDDPKSMKWLLENRTDFGPNGWDALLGSKAMEMHSIDGNHFTLMKDAKQLRRLADLLREFLLRA